MLGELEKHPLTYFFDDHLVYTNGVYKGSMETTIFMNNRSQAVRLRKRLPLPEDAR